ncbi:MAG: hypothetical protein RIR45_1215 [Pseudomonadota bacterium]
MKSAHPLSAHPFDAALALSLQADGSYAGATSPAWQNMVGPFGGVTAGVVANAIAQHPDCLGEPVSLTVNYAAGLAPGAYSLALRAARTNRSTQHWVAEITQAQPDGSVQTVLTATAITAARRDTWSANDTPMPEVPPPTQLVQLATPPGIEWLARYDLRSVRGEIPLHWDGSENDAHPDHASLSQLWVRDVPARPLDFASLTAMADIFFPRVWVRRAKMVPAGTVSLTVYFHADSTQLAQSGDGFLLGQARAQAFRNGFFDQMGQLWSADGHLLATTHQLVYFKE